MYTARTTLNQISKQMEVAWLCNSPTAEPISGNALSPNLKPLPKPPSPNLTIAGAYHNAISLKRDPLYALFALTPGTDKRQTPN